MYLFVCLFAGLFIMLPPPPQSVKTKETNPTRPGSPTRCKQALRRIGLSAHARITARGCFFLHLFLLIKTAFRTLYIGFTTSMLPNLHVHLPYHELASPSLSRTVHFILFYFFLKTAREVAVERLVVL